MSTRREVSEVSDQNSSHRSQRRSILRLNTAWEVSGRQRMPASLSRIWLAVRWSDSMAPEPILVAAAAPALVIDASGVVVDRLDEALPVLVEALGDRVVAAEELDKPVRGRRSRTDLGVRSVVRRLGGRRQVVAALLVTRALLGRLAVLVGRS